MAVTVQFYEHLLEILGDGSIDMDNDAFKVALFDTNHAFDGTDTQLSDISANEIADGNGYTAGGQSLTTVTWSQTAGTVKFDADDPQWTATGGAIETAYHAVIYDDTHANDLLICCISFGVGKTAEEGADLNIVFDATDGIFTIASAA